MTKKVRVVNINFLMTLLLVLYSASDSPSKSSKNINNLPTLYLIKLTYYYCTLQQTKLNSQNSSLSLQYTTEKGICSTIITL